VWHNPEAFGDGVQNSSGSWWTISRSAVFDDILNKSRSQWFQFCQSLTLHWLQRRSSALSGNLSSRREIIQALFTHAAVGHSTQALPGSPRFPCMCSVFLTSWLISSKHTHVADVWHLDFWPLVACNISSSVSATQPIFVYLVLEPMEQTERSYCYKRSSIISIGCIKLMCSCTAISCCVWIITEEIGKLIELVFDPVKAKQLALHHCSLFCSSWQLRVLWAVKYSSSSSFLSSWSYYSEC